jgi:hypothetical protein
MIEDNTQRRTELVPFESVHVATELESPQAAKTPEAASRLADADDKHLA